MNNEKISRRTFVSTSAASVVVAAASRNRVLGANNRLRVGIIGCGGLAQGAHIPSLLKMKDSDNVEIVAVSDVYQKRLDQAATTTGAKPVKDYRALLDQKDIDYVAIVTPEHWHAKMTLDAADAGKHIYCEKPMTWSIEEAKKVVKKIQQSKLKMQVGVQGMSDDSYETAQRMIKEGAIGRPIQAQIDYSRNHKKDFWVSDEPDKDVKPGVNLDWNAFLGPAPKRPFDLDRFLHWRRYWDYSGGIATDLFVHRITRIIRALDLKFPDKAVAVGGKWEFRDSAAEIPDTFNMMLDYPEGLSIVVISSMANDTPIPHVIRGHEATLEFTRDGFIIRPQDRLNRDRSKHEITHKKTGGEDILLHHRNLQAAIRDGAALKCDVMTGYYGVVAVRMAIESYRKRKYVAWDAKRERAVNI
ncbi:MAG: Gfo/Idh/MocA family oxidoreductase [Blastocatellia bacterium]